MVNASDIMKIMGIILKENENRTEYQQKLAAELQERAKKRGADPELPDGVEDSEYIKGTRKTDKSGLTNIAVGVVALIVIAAIIYFVSKK